MPTGNPTSFGGPTMRRAPTWGRRERSTSSRAIALNPTYALAQSGLADTYALLGSYDIMPIRESLGRDAALKALNLNDGLSEPHNSMATILADYYWDWPEADRHFKRAIDLAENNVIALHFYSFYLAYTGRAAEALPLARRAISLDPLSLRAQVNLGVVLNMARRYDEAVSQFVQTLELDSSYGMTHAMLGLSYAYKGMADRAVSELELARKASGDRRDLIALRGYTLARAGRTREALATIEEVHRLASPREPSPFLIAVVAVGLDDPGSRARVARKGVRGSRLGIADDEGRSFLRQSALGGSLRCGARPSRAPSLRP